MRLGSMRGTDRHTGDQPQHAAHRDVSDNANRVSTDADSARGAADSVKQSSGLLVPQAERLGDQVNQVLLRAA